MGTNIKFLLRLFRQPSTAMSSILDQGSLLFASLAVLAVFLLLQVPFGLGITFRFYTPLVALVVVYVPGVLLISNLLAGLGGGLRTVFERDYAPLLTCTAMAFAAANLPLVAAAWFLPAFAFGVLALLSCLYFGVLMFFVVRTVFGTGNGTAVAVVCLSWIPLVAAAFLWILLGFLLGWFASPFFLFFVYYYLGSEIAGLGSGLRGRQNFRRTLEAATVNPHDGDAQYQLGLIYQQRRQYAEAIRRFQNAVAIDPGETDAHFQLGRIARDQGRLKDALECFQTVVNQDEKHSQNEVLRELGALYIAVSQFEDARNELAAYVERRPYDPEGLYYYGQALEGLDRPTEARVMYARATEAVRTAPRYRRRLVARWSRLSQDRLRKL